MARVSLKKDFRDGDKLYGQQLNNNFGAIEAALDAMNKIVWQDDVDESVMTFRGTTEEIQAREITDGQLLYDITTGETYIDYNGERISTGSGNSIHIGSDTPTNAATQLWIDPTEYLNTVGTEVVNSLEGDEGNRAPSVAAVNDAIDTLNTSISSVVQSGSNTNGYWVKYSDGTMICWDKINLGEKTFSQYTSGSALYVTTPGYYDWNYPVEFNSADELIIHVNGRANGYMFTSVGSVYRTYARVDYCTVYPFTSEVLLMITAIGRWK